MRHHRRVAAGSVISVNVGLPREVNWKGKSVRTAIWKSPVIGRVMARRLNVDGDGQGDLAGHGGENRALMVYQLDSYRYWAAYLQRHDFEHGQFGENLTVEGIPDDEVCIGDRYRVGGALFEVTQPRVTCYRVGIRMDNPQMPSLLVSHGRPGFYFRVIEEGEIGAGDEIVKVLDGPEHVTVAEVDALLYLPGRTPDRLQRALRIPALSAGWKESLEALVPPQFQSLRVAATQRESPDVLSFTLESEDRHPLPAPIPGQFLIFKFQTDKTEMPLLRSYSISGPPRGETYRVSVKRGSGRGSQYFQDRIQAGDLLQVSPPRGSFTLAPGVNPVVLLSAGIGATPLLSMLYSLAASGEDSKREIWWCYGTRNREEHLFAAEVQELLSTLPNSHSFIAYSQPENGDRQGADYDVSGHLDLTCLRQLHLPETADFYICGPPAFIADLTEQLEQWGVPPTRVHSEAFGAAAPSTSSSPRKKPHLPEGTAGVGPKVSFAKSGISAPWDEQFTSLVELAEACGVPVKWSCRTGVCHMCESKLLGGRVCYMPEALEPPASGNILLCCATPVTEVELEL